MTPSFVGAASPAATTAPLESECGLFRGKVSALAITPASGQERRGGGVVSTSATGFALGAIPLLAKPLRTESCCSPGAVLNCKLLRRNYKETHLSLHGTHALGYSRPSAPPLLHTGLSNSSASGCSVGCAGMAVQYVIILLATFRHGVTLRLRFLVLNSN
jgi:hypothetical protein